MAARIPQDFLDQLLSRIDIVEVIDRRVSLRKAGHEYGACCPFHNEKTPSFTVSPSKQFYHCFGCGAHGTAIGFLMEYEHLGFVEAVEELAHSVGLEIPRAVNSFVDKHRRNDHSDAIALVEKADSFFRHQLKEHPARQKVLDYLRRRGVNETIIDEFGVGYAPPGWDNLLRALTAQGISPKDVVVAGLAIQQDDKHPHDRFRDRIMFPLRDRRGRTIAFGGRALGDNTPKYLNSPETPFFSKGRELYGLFEARLSERHLPRLVVVEGYMDVLALVQHGIAYAVATLGTATTADHVQKLFRVTNEIVFCFDGDRAGREAAWRALDNALALLRDDRQIRFLFLPEGEDPDTLVRKEGQRGFLQRMKAAKPVSDFFFERLQIDMDLGSVDGRARLAERCRPLLNKLPDSFYRDMLVERLGHITGLDKSHIEKRLAGPAVAAVKPQPPLNPMRTPVRLAIALLLYRIDLAKLAGDMGCFHGIEEAGLPLLVEVVETLQSNAHITHTAQLLIRYEGTKTGQILNRLAEWRPELDEALIEAEFLGVVEKLRKLYVERRLFDKIARGEIDLKTQDLIPPRRC